MQIPVFVVEDDFSTNNMIGWGNNSTREVNNGVMEITNPSQVNPWKHRLDMISLSLYLKERLIFENEY